MTGENREKDFHDVVLEPSDDDNDEYTVLGVDQEGLSEFSVKPYVFIRPQYVRKKGFAKYKASLRHLLPYRKRQKKKNNVIEVDNAGFFSFVTFSWISKYIYKAYKEGLSFEDIPLCSQYESGDLNSQRLGLLWQAELNKNGPENASFGRAVWLFVQTRILISSIIFIITCMLGFITPAIFMQKLIQYAQDPNANVISGLTWAFAFTFSEMLRMLSLALYHGLSYRTATRLKAACLVLVYKKLISLNTFGSKSTGEIINLFGSDSGRLFYMVVFGPMVIGGPIVVICCALYIYINLGPWALLGLSAFLLFYPLQYLLSRLTGYYREKAIRKTDERIRLMTEILNTIKLIKMYAWEACFVKRVQEIRNEELTLLQKGAYCQSIGISLAPTVPVISGILTFIIHVLNGGNLTAAQAYPLVTLLHSQLRSSLLNFRYGSENIIDGGIAFRRIQKLLLLEKSEPKISHPADETVALSVNEGVFTWYDYSPTIPPDSKSAENQELNEKNSTMPFRLESINLCVTKGSLIGICGTVGSGKSTLLKACLGQMKMISGQIHKSGRCAYVNQQAWIENTTLKKNILFGEPFDPKKYINALYCCALNEDVNFFPAGDEIEIGERGVNLSGGQKQRVQLARALYSNREIYFLDDPLSAVDSQVANHIFEKCILGALSKKTVLLVTHQTRFLQKCDEILVMKDGKIVERGTHHELLSKGREYCCLVESSKLISLQKPLEAPEDQTEEEQDMRAANACQMVKDSKFSGAERFTESEKLVRGEVGKFAFQSYVKAAGGYFISFIVFMSIFINVGSNSFSSWWLAIWLKAGSGNTTVLDPSTNETVVSSYINDNPDLNFYMQIYACTIGIICGTSLLRGVTFTKVTVKASKILHSTVLEKLMCGYLRHFEVTPIGRIQNIFSKDFNDVDSRLPGAMETVIQNMWLVMFAFLLITVVFPWFIIALIFLVILYYSVGKIFRVAIRDLKRIEAISKAPIFSFISATINGLPVIHAFGKENEFFSQFCKKFDENSVCSYMSSCAMRWMAIRLDSISVAIALTTSMLVVILKGEVAPAMAGLALTYSAHISGVFQFTLRLMSDIEGKFIAVERMLLTVQKFKSEVDKNVAVEIPPKWPDQGTCKFQNVKLSYSEDLPPVLNGITLNITAGEKIGIVGRTGAGKSSLVVAIFRLVELSQGAIFIDGLDISCVPLLILRSRLSVIPQDPVILSGTLRFNLDPFNKYSDEDIWEVLKRTKLFAKVQSMENGLSTLVGEGGVCSLSVGESQLLCLARALLRGSKILILDEATASVDPDTEEAVQGILNDDFSKCTILTIAHRLKTIKNCEKVLVIHQGLVQEFDNPHKLLNNPNSLFSKMIRELK